MSGWHSCCPIVHGQNQASGLNTATCLSFLYHILLSSSHLTCALICSFTFHLLSLILSNMYHQPDQTGQWPILGPSQQGNHPYLPMRKRKAVDPDDAPPSKKRAVQPRVDDIQHHAQGLGQQALPFYPTASPVAQTYYYPHTQQGLWQQPPPPPVVAAQESAVKRGKRKAVELDDAAPRQDFNIIPINGSISRGSSSNIASTSKKTLEFFN